MLPTNQTIVDVSAHYVTNIIINVQDESNASSNAYALVFRGKGNVALEGLCRSHCLGWSCITHTNSH